MKLNALTWDNPRPSRIQDGSARTHSDYGTFEREGKTYRFVVDRWFNSAAPRPADRSIYEVIIYRNGRLVPERCFKDERVALRQHGRIRVQDAATFWSTQENTKG